MLELLKLTCEELNVMIFPALDYFEIKDWIANHFKVHNSEIFNNLKGIRNDVNFPLKLIKDTYRRPEKC